MKYKDYYDRKYAVSLADKITAVYPAFDGVGFAEYIGTRVDGKEFNDRQDLFAEGLEQALPVSYPEAIAVFTDVLGPELEGPSGMFSDGWWLWPIGRYVERNGTKDFAVSMAFLQELTKRFTGEYAIRPLLEAYPAETLAVLEQWSLDDNMHVRRLASEAIRIRLPWAKKTYAAVRDFPRYTRILTNLKDAPEKFVQKSVGNNLNDLYKEAPEKALRIIEAWRTDDPSKATLWIIKHGLRSASET